MTKSDAAIAIVMCDLVLIYLIWFIIIAVKPIEEMRSDEIEDDSLTGSDFTVVVKQLPYKDHLLQLPGIYWAWAENILEKELEQCTDPDTNQPDIFQNLVLNVNIGLSNYGYLKQMQQMG